MLFFDLECDALLDDLTKIHSCVIIDGEGNVTSCADQEGYTPLKQGLQLLKEADVLVAHNGISFDIPALMKVTGDDSWYNKKIIDTHNLSRLVFPEISVTDTVMFRTIPKKMVGKHSLEAWGHRLKYYKGDFGKTNSWKEWSKEMQDYCVQDVRLLVELYKFLMSKKPSEESVNTEMDFQRIISRQYREGFPFNKAAGEKLAQRMLQEEQEIKNKLSAFVKYHVKRKMFIPKRDNKTKGYIAGRPIVQEKQEPFNYTSRLQIVSYLKEKRGWQPVDFTDKGNVELGADLLRSLPWEECELFAQLFDIQKIQGRLVNGDSAWLKYCKNGKVYGDAITNGAVTSRCTHNIISNIPKAKKYLGREVRSLFGNGLQVGCDAKSLELRVLGHYMAAYDNGSYAHEVVEGDVHTSNQNAAGLPTRDDAKTFIYAFLYGAGDPKLGSIVSATASLAEQKAMGKALRNKFLAGFPALDSLIRQVKAVVKSRGYLIGIDGRILPVRAQHSALNTLLQSCGAIVMKKACIFAWDIFEQHGLKHGIDVVQLIHYHDEMQFKCKDEATCELVGQLTSEAITKAGEYFKMKCKLEGDYKLGSNWYECH